MENKNEVVDKIFNSAVQDHQKNQLESAKNSYEQILKIDPNNFKTTFLLGSLFLQTKNFEKAEKLLSKAVELKSDYADAYNNLGLAYFELNEYKKSENCYQKAINIKPESTNAYINIASLFRKNKKYNEAKIYYEKVLKKEPNRKEACLGYSKLLLLLGNHKEGLNYMQKGEGCIKFGQKKMEII